MNLDLGIQNRRNSAHLISDVEDIYNLQSVNKSTDRQSKKKLVHRHASTQKSAGQTSRVRISTNQKILMPSQVSSKKSPRITASKRITVQSDLSTPKQFNMQDKLGGSKSPGGPKNTLNRLGRLTTVAGKASPRPNASMNTNVHKFTNMQTPNVYKD